MKKKYTVHLENLDDESFDEQVEAENATEAARIVLANIADNDDCYIRVDNVSIGWLQPLEGTEEAEYHKYRKANLDQFVHTFHEYREIHGPKTV